MHSRVACLPRAPVAPTCDSWRTSSTKGPAALITARAYTLTCLPVRLSRTTAPITRPSLSCTWLQGEPRKAYVTRGATLTSETGPLAVLQVHGRRSTQAAAAAAAVRLAPSLSCRCMEEVNTSSSSSSSSETGPLAVLQVYGRRSTQAAAAAAAAAAAVKPSGECWTCLEQPHCLCMVDGGGTCQRGGAGQHHCQPRIVELAAEGDGGR